jgi:hypothetical protein
MAERAEAVRDVARVVGVVLDDEATPDGGGT